jgi:hypothetical protein
VKLRILILAAFLVLIWFVAPVRAENTSSSEGIADNIQEVAPPLKTETKKKSRKQAQPLKTYFLEALPGGTRRSIKLSPPATRLVVSSESGDTAIRFGDGVRNYSAKPGNPQPIEAEPDAPIEKIWAENPTEKRVRLRIDVYQALTPASEEEAAPEEAT